MNHKNDKDLEKNDQTKNIVDDNAQSELSPDTKASAKREADRNLL